MDFHRISDHELLADVGRLVGSERELTAKLARYLAEIEERRLHLQAGFSSMFEFCVKELGLSEGAAFRRILAARLGRRFPVVYSLLASGAVHLSALELVRERLTQENHAELLDAVSRKTTRDVEALLAERFPRPDVPSRIRKAGRIEPLSKSRYKVEFTATAELCEKLELCRDLSSHANPSRDLAVVIERAVDLLLADLERRRLARTKRGKGARVGVTRNERLRRVSNAARRQVFERDGLRCTYVSPSGRRCGARAFLELDHAHPRGVGGSSEPENLRVLCRSHNQLWAEQAYGREHVERHRHFRQRMYGVTAVCENEAPPGGGENEALRATFENGVQSDRSQAAVDGELTRTETATLRKLRMALRGLGFGDSDARRAVETVARRHTELPTIEQALREAVLAATTSPV